MNITTLIISIITILILFAIVIMAVDTHRLKIREYEVSSDLVKKDLNIVFLTDLHSKSFGRANAGLIKAIDDLKPDAVFVGGDMYTAAFSDQGDVSQALLKELSGRYPIYCANGNHEQKTKERAEEFPNIYDRYRKFLADTGIVCIENESVFLDEHNIRVYGLELPFRYYRKLGRENPGTEVINECIGRPSDKEFTLLMAHNPQYFDDYAAWGADLTLSGHVHGGLVRLPLIGGVLSPNYRFFPKYSGGRYEIGSSVMVLSCGLGTHHIPLRVFNPGELSAVRIKSLKQ